MNVPAKVTDPMAEFQEKMRERVRNDIRDLLPEDAIAGLVKRAIEDEFFQPRKVSSGYGRYDEKPSWFVEEVVKAATPIMKAAVDRCIAEHPDAVEQAIKQFLDKERLTILVSMQLVGKLYDMMGSMSSQFNQIRT